MKSVHPLHSVPDIRLCNAIAMPGNSFGMQLARITPLRLTNSPLPLSNANYRVKPAGDSE
jgi:hypothetical protein